MKKIRSIEDNLNRIATALENGALDNISGGGGSSEETWTTVFDDSITTVVDDGVAMATFEPSASINTDTIKVTFDGVEYECQNQAPSGAPVYVYGGINLDSSGFDFSVYPFAIQIPKMESTGMIATSQEGTYTLKIEVPESSDGSGSGDFSIANVTIESDISGTCTALIPIAKEQGVDPARIYVQPSLAVQAGAAPLEYNIPIYKGLAIIEIYYSEISGINRVDVTGDIVNNGDEYFYIRGDGHINLKQPTY